MSAVGYSGKYHKLVRQAGGLMYTKCGRIINPSNVTVYIGRKVTCQACRNAIWSGK